MGTETQARRADWGHWLRCLRKRQGSTLEDLARAIGIHESYLCMMEGRGYIPRRAVVERIASALGVSPDEALLRAGYVPRGVPVEKMLEAVTSIRMGVA